MKKIGIWGQFGDGGQIADGQAVRTTIITNEIKNRYGQGNVNVLNTNKWYRNPIHFFIKSIGLVFNSRKIIIFPADNGLKVVVPIINIANIFCKRDLYYVVIGGFLPDFLNKNKRYIRYLAKYRALFVQTINLKNDLKKIGLKNIFILSNLKRLKKIRETDLVVNDSKRISVCTLSRVTYTKGIEDAIEAVNIANRKLGENLIHLDIYGMLDLKYEERFKELVSSQKEYVTYKGIIDYDKTVDTLKNYFALLFPTFFHGEGFSGNVIDAYYSGLPIIATDWLYNKDVILDNINGILVPVNDPEAISNAILKLYNNRELTFHIAANNIQEADKYTPELVLKEFFELLDKEYIRGA